MKHKVPPAYSRALPIHANSGREWEPENARSLTAVGMTHDIFTEFLAKQVLGISERK